MKKLLLIIIGIVIFFWIIGKCGHVTKVSDDTTQVTTSTAVKPAPIPAEKPVNWSYNRRVDKMDNVITYWAINESKDILIFESPYDGGSTINLQIRKKGNNLDIFFMVSKGQFQTYNRYARLKFDNNKPINVSLSDAADGSSDYVFIANPASIISRIQKSKMLLAELPFYQEGSKQVSFDLEGLEWNH